ncbi:MAG: hypothetical protein B7Y93_07145 [Micrococcales bacterium 32-70-13]|nr:MAG: hypothetical protein B7Y93_07145 [Micrococcales bacterium 32-70-13]
MILLAVAVGGALGAVLRQLVSVGLAGRGRVPWGALVVNVVGSFIAGLALALPLDPGWQIIVLSGFCGGLTTFSTFAVETVQLMIDRKARAAVLNVTLSIALGLLAVVAGILIGGLLG